MKILHKIGHFHISKQTVCHYYSLWDTCKSSFLALCKVDFIMSMQLEIRTTLQFYQKFPMDT